MLFIKLLIKEYKEERKETTRGQAFKWALQDTYNDIKYNSKKDLKKYIKGVF